MLLLSLLRAIPQRRCCARHRFPSVTRASLSCSALRHNGGSFHMGQEVDLFFTSRLSRERCSTRCLRPCSITGEHPFNIRGHFSSEAYLFTAFYKSTGRTISWKTKPRPHPRLKNANTYAMTVQTQTYMSLHLPLFKHILVHNDPQLRSKSFNKKNQKQSKHLNHIIVVKTASTSGDKC